MIVRKLLLILTLYLLTGIKRLFISFTNIVPYNSPLWRVQFMLFVFSIYFHPS